MSAPIIVKLTETQKVGYMAMAQGINNAQTQLQNFLLEVLKEQGQDPSLAWTWDAKNLTLFHNPPPEAPLDRAERRRRIKAAAKSKSVGPEQIQKQLDEAEKENESTPEPDVQPSDDNAGDVRGSEGFPTVSSGS